MRNTIAILVFFCTLSFAQSNFSRTPFASYLLLPASARDEALGEAFPTLNTNPAATLSETGIIVLAGYRYRWADAMDNFLSAAGRMKKYSAFVHLNLSGVSELEGRSYATAEPDYIFGAERVNIMIGGAYRVHQYIWTGIAYRHIYEHLEFHSLDANTFSIGVFASWRDVSVGISAIDYGSDDSYIEYIYPAPTVYRAQALYQWKIISLGAAFTKPDMLNGYGSIAAEISPIYMLDFRASYTIGHSSRSFAGGAQFNWNNFSIAYTIATYGELGINHFISLGYQIPILIDDSGTDTRY